MSWDDTDINDKFKLAKCWIREVNPSNADNQIKKEVMRQYARSRGSMAYDDASIDAMISQMPAWRSFQDVYYGKNINPNTLNESLYDPIRSFRQFRDFKTSLQSQTQSNSIEKLKAYLINGTPHDIESVLNSIKNDDILNIISNMLQSVDDDQLPEYYEQLIRRLINIYKTHLTKVKGIPVMHENYKITWNPSDNLVQKQSLTNAIFKIFESNHTTNFENVEKNALCALWKEYYVDSVCMSYKFYRQGKIDMFSDRTLGFGVKYKQNYSCDFFKWFGNKIPFWAIRLMQSNLEKWYTFDQLKRQLINISNDEKRKIEIQKEQERKEQKEQSDIKKREYIKVYEYMVNTQIPFDKEKIDNTIEMWKRLNYSDKTTLGQIILVLHEVLQRLNDIDSFEEFTFENSEDFFIEKISFIDDKLVPDTNIDEDTFDEYKDKIVEQLNKYIDAKIEEEERARKREDVGALSKRVQVEQQRQQAQRKGQSQRASSSSQTPQSVTMPSVMTSKPKQTSSSQTQTPQRQSSQSPVIIPKHSSSSSQKQLVASASSFVIPKDQNTDVMISKVNDYLNAKTPNLKIMKLDLKSNNEHRQFLFDKILNQQSGEDSMCKFKEPHYSYNKDNWSKNTEFLNNMISNINRGIVGVYMIVKNNFKIKLNKNKTWSVLSDVYGFLIYKFYDNKEKLEEIGYDETIISNFEKYVFAIDLICSQSGYGKALILNFIMDISNTIANQDTNIYVILESVLPEQTYIKSKNQNGLVNWYNSCGFISSPTPNHMWLQLPTAKNNKTFTFSNKIDYSNIDATLNNDYFKSLQKISGFAPYPQSFDTFSNLMASAMAPSTIVQTWNPFSAISFKQNAEAFGRRMIMRQRCPYHKQQNCPYSCPYGGVAPPLDAQ